MGRRTKEVDKDLLQQALNQAENGRALKNLDTLWKKAVKIYNKSGPPEEITFSVVSLRAKQWNLEHITKAGKRGRAAGTKLSAEQKEAMQAGRTSRADKFQNDPDKAESCRQILAEGEKMDRIRHTDRFSNLAQKVVGGSMRAAVQMKCLECSSYQSSEVRRCHIQGCPLWPFLQRNLSEAESEDEAEELQEAA